jgi:ABC-2 type transport system permease protein
MKWTRIAAIVLRQLFLYRGSPQRVLPIFAWVAVDILLWGFITRYLNAVSHTDFNFVPALLGAVLLWAFLARVMQGVTMAFFEDVWSRNFLNFFATPLRTSEYITGLVITGIATSLIGLAVMFLLASTVFGLSFATYGVVLAPFLAILFLTGIALGITGAATVLRLGPASEWLIWPIPSILAPFAAVYYPVAVLPTWMRAISWMLPPSYGFEGVRAVVLGHPVSWEGLMIGGGLAVAYLVLACLLFGAVYRFAIRTGLIARYSAETVS